MCAIVANCAASGRPLRGIVHAAGLLDDGVLLRLTPERLRAPFAAKLGGALALEQATADTPLDFFLLFSSAAALLGSPGQASYAAANASLDALARRRRANGLPAISIAWGPWAQSGMAARTAQHIPGLDPIQPDTALNALASLLDNPTPYRAVLSLDPRRVLQSANLPILHHLASPPHKAQVDTEMVSRLRQATSQQRQTMLTELLQREAASVLGYESDVLPPVDEPLLALGLDSLMLLELKNRLRSRLGVNLGIAALFSHPTISALVPVVDVALAPPDSSADTVAALDRTQQSKYEMISAMAESEAELTLRRMADEVLQEAGYGRRR